MKILLTYPEHLIKLNKSISGGIIRQILDFEKYMKDCENINASGIIFEYKRKIKSKIGLPPKINKFRGVKYYHFYGDSTEIAKLLKRAKSFKEVIDDDLTKDIIKQVVDVIKREKADAVFIYGMPSWYVWFVREAARRLGKPVIMVHTGVWKREINMYKDLIRPSLRKIYYALEKDFCAPDVWNIFVSDVCRDCLRKEVFGRKEYHGAVIYPSLEYNFLFGKPRTGPHLGRKKIRVGVVGRWDRIKNHEAVLELAKYIKKHGDSAQFYSVTKIPKTKKKINFKKSYRKIIKVMKYMPAPKLSQFFKSMDVIIVPSHFESFNIVALESLAMGTPVLINKNVGIVSLYKKVGLNNWILNFKNNLKVLRAIERAAENPVPEKVIEYVKNNFTADKTFIKYLKVAKEAVEKYKN